MTECELCLYGDECPDEAPCDWFTPFDDNGEEVLLEALNISKRSDFSKEWNKYTNEWSD